MSSSEFDVCRYDEADCYVCSDINPFPEGLNFPLPDKPSDDIFEAMTTAKEANGRGSKIFRTLNQRAKDLVDKSTDLDSWTPNQLKMMSFGGNNRAQVFFKQHGWTDGGEIEAKYTSRAAELYKQLLSKEDAKSHAEVAANSFPSSLVETLDKPYTDFKPFETLKENPTPTPTPATAPKLDTNGSALDKPRI
ncbi:probable ADP-ribosylation factor GTPase-activating protein AGD9 [Lactuca sativa]|uniref:probable ADP-ribosylation factor GTPase-activating protein AGD9 n=1 Tax=Lactuca sativa TaxID=4236 RepID=UPI000CD9823F|nr:probable ADP-ribosylation factor GTPase-activating protein AGD9 [Lactuca sativa]